MQAKLVIVEPENQTGEYEVTLPMTIGRGNEATLKLVHALISRQHCELFADRGRIMVRDLGSLNGTFIGGQRVETAPLQAGELLTVGSVTLRLVCGSDVALAATGRKGKAGSGSVDTVSLEDTSEAGRRPDEEELVEPLGFGDDEPGRFYRPSDN